MIMSRVAHHMVEGRAIVLLRRGGGRHDRATTTRWREAWPAGDTPKTTMVQDHSRAHRRVKAQVWFW